MDGLSAQTVLEIWERTLRADAVRTPLTILGAADRDLGDDALLDMSVGERDRRLLELRRQIFGDRLDSFIHCPQCGERLEFTMDADDLGSLGAGAAHGDAALEFEHDALRVQAHAPTSRDLLAIRTCADPSDAAQLLLHRCVERLHRDGQPLAVDALSDADVRIIGEHLADRQGLADLMIEIACTACGHRWDMPFDIASFFTVELRRYATQLLDEVHLLATAYGWEEPVILTMHPVRRRAYLERVLA